MLSYRKLQKYFPEERIRNIKDAIDRKVKPLGSLGLLEDLALEIALILENAPGDTISLTPQHLIFAGDHGVAAAHPVSIVSGDFTVKMINNFIEGGAAINAFLEESGIPFEIINSGIRHPEKLIPGNITVRNCSLGFGTRDLGTENAMSDAELKKAALYGKEIAEAALSRHCNVLLFGEMGIGNTTAASAVMAALTGLSPEECTGRGTGIGDAALALKISLIKKGLSRLPENPSPEEILRTAGGYEIAEMAYTMIHACGRRIMLVIDGFIVTAAALLAVKIAPKVRGQMIFATESGEPGHRLMLERLDATPLLRLGLRLGEGTGAVLSYSLIKAAAAFFSRMAEWDSTNGRIIFRN
ncbi:nicotinate-nucleotide--dimethylbenzimidazole phosphoribosyltransferase [Succinimonas amylolytica]|uniref:nicotinate-nucleotide--dimethylbenzimidazole phosphoribosyltransferase n=1 Tax=Succinimonas amylolytica TaxID=83769 RepID=UPI000376F92C|nr:nicotinate-nucleotide--dimethylbenzimidazole phosphoribosyltransferase [Succinimonas amylolytica]